MGGGDTEDTHDRLADELLDRPAERYNRCACHREVGGEHPIRLEDILHSKG